MKKEKKWLENNNWRRISGLFSSSSGMFIKRSMKPSATLIHEIVNWWWSFHSALHSAICYGNILHVKVSVCDQCSLFAPFTFIIITILSDLCAVRCACHTNRRNNMYSHIFTYKYMYNSEDIIKQIELIQFCTCVSSYSIPDYFENSTIQRNEELQS